MPQWLRRNVETSHMVRGHQEEVSPRRTENDMQGTLGRARRGKRRKRILAYQI